MNKIFNKSLEKQKKRVYYYNVIVCKKLKEYENGV